MVRAEAIEGLSGPKGEPRITEALNVGSVTLSSDPDLASAAKGRGSILMRARAYWRKSPERSCGTIRSRRR